MELDELKQKISDIPYWYHRIDLGNGVTTPGWAPIDPDKYMLPDRMDGETVLDVGAWDGYWTFEALRRGAEYVLAIDDFSDTCGKLTNADRSGGWDAMRTCAEALGCSDDIDMINNSIEDYCAYECFDRVFMFGVIYHLMNPLIALSNCFRAIKPGGFIHVETAILDNVTSAYTGRPHDPNGCYAEFFPGAEFALNSSNWWVPTLKCAKAWIESVGFIEVETWKFTDRPTHLAECRGFLKATKP